MESLSDLLLVPAPPPLTAYSAVARQEAGEPAGVMGASDRPAGVTREGVDVFLTKPFSPIELTKHVKRLLGGPGATMAPFMRT
jgi:CheY-like chemotaxis protein